MATSELGKVYRDTEIIIQQGERGDDVYVIQEGLVEVIKETEQGEVHLGLRGKGEFFGEMAFLEHQDRSATVRAVGEARVLRIDKRHFLRRMYEDATLAFRLMQAMSACIRQLSMEVAQQQNQLERLAQ